MKFLLQTAAILAVFASTTAFAKSTTEVPVKPGQTMNCPIFTIVADKDTGIKGANENGDIDNNLAFATELKLDKNLSAEKEINYGNKGLAFSLSKDEVLNIFGLFIYIFDPSKKPAYVGGTNIILKFDKVSTGGGWDGEAGTNKYIFIKDSLSPLGGVAFLDFNTRKALLAAGLINQYDFNQDFDPASTQRLIEPLKAAVKKGIVKDGELVGAGTAFSCNLK